MRYSTLYGFFSIDPMPNQPSVAWCSDFTVFTLSRKQGMAHALKAYQNKVLSDEGFTLAMCSVKESNIAQIKVLTKADWNHKTSFQDVRTGEMIQLWVYGLDQGF